MSRLIAVALVAGSCLFAGLAAAALPEEGRYYLIKPAKGKMVLGLDEAAKDLEGSLIVLKAQGPFPGQHWTFIKAGDYYKIVNRKSGRALNVQNASTADNAPIIQWDASDPGENQQWSLEAKGKGFVFKARHSGLVLDVADDEKQRKTPLIQFTYHEGRNQKFELLPVEDSASETNAPPAGTRRRNADLTEAEQEIAKAINAVRKRKGLEALKINPKLVAECREHARTMAARGELRDAFDGRSPGERITGTGITPGDWGIASGKGNSTDAVVKEWITSPIAAANILAVKVNELGIGVVAAKNGEIYAASTYAEVRE